MRVRSEEHSPAVGEPASHRRLDPREATVNPEKRPSVRVLVVQPDRHPVEAAGRELALVHVGGTAEDRPASHRRLERLPLVAASEPLLEVAVRDPPAAVQEVEVGGAHERAPVVPSGSESAR